ncbi:sugar phosphate isomerase/epimerase family protein [Limnochorda pilosa]|uniref:Xylose isomerase n=1 Tax=Limnochorda pilosa TaxID=1555112 RepID=A0A0K2SL04_LIMPI|nr:sugar phosphate isomerase/epimerase [Limnochorda pilosa]BAS27780.1 xylose isomerase [Limnochorda pilosa]
MKLGVLTVLFGNRPLEETLEYVKAQGLDAVEIGCGGYPGKAHCDPDRLLQDEGALRAFRAAVDSRGLAISALSVHGNPLHPQAAERERYRREFRQAVTLASRLGVERVNTFSGCPGDHPGARWPNWVTCAWPPDYQEVLRYQWEEEAIPYWREEMAFCRQQGVRMIGLEMHPGFLVYNPETALRLREAVGPELGVNFDPSHLWWQGVEPVHAIRALGEAIFHVHAKDTALDPINFPVNGGLDTTPYGREAQRSWIFRSVGYGHDLSVWRDLVSALRLVGYDWVLSIEHEDSLMSGQEGFEKAVATLKEAVIREAPGAMWWA